MSALLRVIGFNALPMLGFSGCVPEPYIKDQCPASTFPDNTAAGKSSVTISGNIEAAKQTGGAAVTASGEGSARYTCRQMCPSGDSPNVDESTNPTTGTTFKYHCDAKGDKPASDYVETHSSDGTKAVGTILTPAAAK